jgi:hypothetical protein
MRRITGTLHKDVCTSGHLPLKTRNVLDKCCRESQTHVLCSITLFLKNRFVYEIMWENMVEQDKPQMTV